ncbi:MAG: UDP-2,3-diacylglucosamine diphosphatase [Candidatus Marinimicrobia bacterium]|jgi:UDP-2,3-diacylglucosamine hydrolase|nr:UDP-2,3-diacylglucosamine diphosphatase [Candidatus Neomarinimicrobiota bacterium]MDP6852999.1 UDP-2,3-diacylglucosamine diphosphatase [Candidatus Neomarinimicrobiota bacterium]MDP6935805.1 UDP-2,3-diacylglucosamine diphosphatase [Candidatus Neomarinimicrobiota bacterium]
MYNLPVYVVSDNHFKMDVDQYELERRQKLYHVFDVIKSTGGTLIIGGDFFDFWFNYRHVVPAGYSDLLENLEELHHSGIHISFVLGNHDFWDFGYFNKKFGAEVIDGILEFSHDVQKIQVNHGDGLLRKDRSYRLMKKVIRSKIAISLFRQFHPDWGCGLANKVSKASGHYHHHDNKSEAIRSEMTEYARSQWQLGYSTVLLGHYHQKGIVEENGHSLIFLGDWLRHFTVTRLTEDGWWQGAWNEV